MTPEEFQKNFCFIGFDGYTGSMQPAYAAIHEKGLILDGFLKPVPEEKREAFLLALHDPAQKQAFYIHDNHHWEVEGNDPIDGATIRQNEYTFYVPRGKFYTQAWRTLKNERGYELFS